MPHDTSLDQPAARAKPRRAHGAGNRSRGLLRVPMVALWVGLCPLSPPLLGADLEWPELRFRASEVVYGEVSLTGVSGRLEPDGGFVLAFDGGRVPAEGLLQSVLAEGQDIAGRIEQWSSADGTTTLTAMVAARGLEGRVGMAAGPSGLGLSVELDDQPATVLAALPGMPAAAGWLRAGTVDLDLRSPALADPAPALDYRLQLRDCAFDSPDGRFAAEGLAVSAAGQLDLADTLAFEVAGRFAGGELLLDDFYRNFADGGLDYALRGVVSGDELALSRIAVEDGGALKAEASARFDLGKAGEWALEVSRLALNFPGAYGRYLEPIAAAWTLDGLEVTGFLDWSGEWASGELLGGELRIGDFSVVDVSRERFAVTGLEAQLRPGDHDFDSRLGWQGLLLGSVNLGAGQAMLETAPGAVALKEPLRLEVLGGRLSLDTLAVALPGGRGDAGGEPDVALAASLERLDMARLTAALGWPEFGGTISGNIPGVSLQDGVLGVDGEIRFDVFDGRVTLRNLRIERAFGVLPSLAADIGISDLDLQQLTSTFSFGQIAGRLDGRVDDLRMLDWKPVAFDAWVGTPERQQGARDISRQAVNRLTTIGGGAPTAALTGPLMRMFSNFAYRRLGLGCTLQDNVCHLHGLSDDGAGVLILEGAGVPKITIRAFNRDIDWPQMVANLVAISEGDSIRVGDAPNDR